MKKNYQKPAINVETSLSANLICASQYNTVQDINSDDVGYGGGSDNGGDGTGAHARLHSDWDDD